MKHQKTSFVVVPILLIITGSISSLTLKNQWNFEIASYSIFLFTLVYILVFERIIPLKQEWKPQKNVLWIDIKHLFFSVAIFDALGKTVAIALLVYFQKYVFETSSLWNTFPFILNYIIANLVGELLPYWYHRISHIGKHNSYISLLLWKIHAIHHLPTTLNWFKTNWMHPINMFLNTLLKMGPILLLGFNEEIIFLVGITHVVIAYISHANIETEVSFLDYIVVTPQIHHFHHSKKMEEAKNFGNIIPFWDLVFGTYYNRKGKVYKVGVIKDTKINYPKPTEYFRQLLFPLFVFKKCCR